MDGGDRPVNRDNLLNESSNYAATFHVYINKQELPIIAKDLPTILTTPPEDGTRDIFRYIDEVTHKEEKFTTHSDISWQILRKIIAAYAAEKGL